MSEVSNTPSGFLSINPSRYGGGEPTLWTASWLPERYKAAAYDASGATIELALAALIEVMGQALADEREARL